MGVIAFFDLLLHYYLLVKLIWYRGFHSSLDPSQDLAKECKQKCFSIDVYMSPKNVTFLIYPNNIYRSWHFQPTLSTLIIPQPELNKDITFLRRGGLGWQTPNFSDDISQQHIFSIFILPNPIQDYWGQLPVPESTLKYILFVQGFPRTPLYIFFNLSQPYFPK